MLEGWEVFLTSIGKERRSREGCVVCGDVDCGGGFVLADESGVVVVEWGWVVLNGL